MEITVIWALAIIFSFLVYVIMDSYDLGLGILLITIKNKQEQDIVMDNVASIWDGNEAWLILSGAALFGAFPLASTIIVEALYLPMSLVLLGLVFRGIAYRFRIKASDDNRHWWNKFFIGGSVAATFFQGVALGIYINGIPVENNFFVGSAFDWFKPFPLFCGFVMLLIYAQLGSTWLIIKTEGRLQEHMYRYSSHLMWFSLSAIFVVGLWTSIVHPSITERWLNLPEIIYLFPIPVTLLLIISTAGMYAALVQRATVAPFLLSLIVMILSYGAIAISFWPNIIPPSISLRHAASSDASNPFALVGGSLTLIGTIIYTAWRYYVFRKKSWGAE